MVRYLGSLLKGGVYSLGLLAAFPNNIFAVPLWWGAFLGLAGVVLEIRRRDYLAAGCAGGFFYAGLLYWVSYSMEGIIPLIALVLLQLLYWGAWLIICNYGQKYQGMTWASWVGVAFCGCETLRAVTPWGGNPWGIIAFTQIDGFFKPWIEYLAQVGMSFIVVFLATMLAENLWVYWGKWQVISVKTAPGGVIKSLANLKRDSFEKTQLNRLNYVSGIFIFLTLLANFGFGNWLVSEKNPLPQADLLVVQGNVEQPVRKTLANRNQILRNHLQETKTALENADTLPDVVIWGEQAADVYPDSDEETRLEIERFFHSYHLPLWFGSVRVEKNYRYNEYLHWDKNAVEQEKYLKQVPVPFGEFLPWRNLFEFLYPPVKDLLPSDIKAGEQVGILRTGKIQAGVNICFEIAVESVVEANIAAGANLLLTPTNNMSFGESPQSLQQLQIVRFRAREFGRSSVQASINGVSGISDRKGNTVVQSGLFTPGHFRVQVPLYSDRSVASYIAYYLRVLAILGCGLQGLSIGISKYRNRNKPIPVQLKSRSKNSFSETNQN